MSSFSSVSAVQDGIEARQLWRGASVLAGWVTGTLAMACVTAAVVLGGATAAVQRTGVGLADGQAAWARVAALFAVGLVLAGAAYVTFAAAERESARERASTAG